MNKETLLEQAIQNGRENGYVDVVEIANKLGISVYGISDKDDFNAKITYEKDTGLYKLFVNENHPLGRQRFSIAHELGHFVLHTAELTELGSLDRDENGDSIMEQDADAFAAEILMPTELVEEFIVSENCNKNDITNSVIEKMADRFKVSRIVAIIRLRDLDYYVRFLSLA